MTTRIQRRGRPSGLTPQREKIIFRAIREGASFSLAAELAGITYTTLNRWRIVGSTQTGSTELCHFCERLQAAQAEGALELMRTISDAARKGDWKAAAWKLERRYPDEYGRQAPATREMQHEATFHTIRKSLSENDKMAMISEFIHEMEQDGTFAEFGYAS